MPARQFSQIRSSAVLALTIATSCMLTHVAFAQTAGGTIPAKTLCADLEDENPKVKAVDGPDCPEDTSRIQAAGTVWSALIDEFGSVVLGQDWIASATQPQPGTFRVTFQSPFPSFPVCTATPGLQNFTVAVAEGSPAFIRIETNSTATSPPTHAPSPFALQCAVVQ